MAWLCIKRGGTGAMSLGSLDKREIKREKCRGNSFDQRESAGFSNSSMSIAIAISVAAC